MIQGKRIWDISCVPDRDETRMELTDLIRFKGHWYCGFREGKIHCDHPSGRARIICSADGEHWESAALFEWDGGSIRTPRLSITAEGVLMAATSIYFVSKLPRLDAEALDEAGELLPPEVTARMDHPHCYFQLDQPGTPATDAEPQVARQSVSWLSRDGVNWSTAFADASGVNAHRWSVTWHNGMGYSNSETGKDRGGTLYRTRDGKTWRDDGRINLFLLDPHKAILTQFAEFDGTSYPGIFEHEGMLWVTFTDTLASEVLLGKVRAPD